MGVRNYLVEGVSGTGKTSVCRELNRRGYEAVHGDRELAYQGDPETGEATETASHHHHIWDVGRVRDLAADHREPVTFFCGGSRNFSKFLDLFDGVFVLDIDLGTLQRRLDQRPPDEWGSKPSERELIVRLHRTKEDIPASGVVIDATRPLADVVDEILRQVRLAELPRAVTSLATRLAELGWVSDLLVAGSLATGDHVPGVSDLDLVAVVTGPVDPARTARLVEVHEELDGGSAAGTDLGCVYVDEDRLTEPSAPHPTWTHGRLVARTLSGVTRAELVRHGFAVLGRRPTDLLPPMADDAVRAAARAELCGYWAWAARRPYLWWDPTIADLGLTAMARGRHTLRTGQLLTKSRAIEEVRAPAWLVDELRARRRGEPATSPRLRTGWIAWRDARATTRDACAGRT